jgi:hypothetical protein
MSHYIKIDENGLFIRPSRQYYDGIGDEELYEITRGIWKVGGQRREKAEYAFTVIGFKIIAVYKIHSWHKALETEYHLRKDRNDLYSLPQDEIHNRYEFLGEVDKGMQQKYLGKDVSDYFVRGNANPVKYINCF